MPLAHLLSQLDLRPDARGRQFERICAWYLRNAPEYTQRIRNVWLWSEWPGAWAADAGIDLVAEEHDHRRWAIQAKAYDPSYAIKKADVDSFLSESSRPQFSYRLLIATTDRLGPTARRTLDAQREPVGYLLRSQLELAQVAWPASLDDLRLRRPPRKKPLPHVREAINATIRGFRDHERGQLIMACGTGKTLAAMWIAERLASTRSLVLVPSLSLLAQTLREWTANATEPFQYLAVCSDETVATEDEFTQHTAELGLPVTTDADEIAAFLRKRGRRVVFATYQSSPQIAAAFTRGTSRFDLVIADEAHRCAGRVASEFATVLDRDAIRSRRRLFMTATPRFYTPRLRKEAGLADVEIASMDDSSLFGPVLHRLTFGEAIERDLLSDYQVAIVGVESDTYRSWAERGRYVTRDGRKISDARALAAQIVLAKAMRKYKLRRVISFHGRVKAAADFSRELPDTIAWLPGRIRPRGVIWSEHVSGAMTSGHRDRLLLRFRNVGREEIGLLSNARCLGEGVDIPTLDGVAFIDPRRSTTDIVQAIGRAIRKAPDKRLGTIVLPVFISDEDPERVLHDSAFRHVWDVLKALRAHDETLGEELDELRRELGARRSPPRRPGKIKLDLPAHVGAAFANAFNVRLVERTTSSWEFWFGLLERYAQRERHARPQAAHREDGFRLGGWVSNQIQLKRVGRLPADQVERLEALPGWTWTLYESWWDASYDALVRFAEREGHAAPSQGHVEGDVQLGMWVVNQRQAFKRGRLSKEQSRKLERLRGWTWDVRKAAWDRGIQLLYQYVAREHNALVPQRHVEDGFRLGEWVSELRNRGHRRLSSEQTAALERLPGWAWNKHDASWNAHFEALRHFAQRERHSRPAQRHIEDGLKLGGWVANQRNRADILTDHQRAQLEALPGWTWRPSSDAWERGASALRTFVARERHADVPTDWIENGYPLGRWVAKRRGLRRAGRLRSEHADWLESQPGWSWHALDERWDRCYELLAKYADEHGSATLPAEYTADGIRLGGWVNVQRTAHMRGKLNKKRKRRLEQLPGWAWKPHDAKWERSFAALVDHSRKTGLARPPRDEAQDGIKVGQWASLQRSLFREDKLSPQRAERLSALPGWEWDPHDAKWDRRYELLRAYAEQTGHARPPLSTVVDGIPLGTWVDSQRQQRRKGQLRPDRVRALEALPGWRWRIRSDAMPASG